MRHNPLIFNHLSLRLTEYGVFYIICPRLEKNRAVAQLARAPDSKSGGWGFESLQPCIALKENRDGKRCFFNVQ